MPLWTNALITVLLFSSLALLVWVSGQISLCHAPFVALGATNMSHMQDKGVPWALAVLFAGLLTVPVGVLIALPAIRLSGLYLALATLGFGIVNLMEVIGAVFAVRRFGSRRFRDLRGGLRFLGAAIIAPTLGGASLAAGVMSACRSSLESGGAALAELVGG